MDKIKLKLEDIQVNGFEVLPAEAAGAGTVKGAEDGMLTENTRCEQYTCWNGSCGTGNPCRICP
ncbi:MAG TPA: hypothetical protein VF092_19595 [Longimicrobium sp.]